MKRALAAIAAAVAFTIGPNLPAEAQTWRSKECRFQTLDGQWGWTGAEVSNTIHCAAARFGIDERMARLVASHESGYQAVTGYDTYCGVYQLNRHSFPAWFAGTRARWPSYAVYGARCENARTNIFTAFNLVKDSGGWYAHWCRWTYYC